MKTQGDILNREQTKDVMPEVKKRLAVYTDTNMRANIIEKANDSGLSVSSYLNMILKKEFNKNVSVSD